MTGFVLTNAVILTSNAAQPTADTIVVEDGVIAFVGQRRDYEDARQLPRHDLGGRVVIPGLIDAHTHPTMVSKSFWHTRLPWTSNIDEILEFIRDYATQYPKEVAPYLYFEYYPSETFADRPPSKELLDSVVSDRPVLCQDFNDHEHWVNSRMLELMEITSDTPDPVPGLEMFVRDDLGEPTGQLREFVHLGFIDRMFDKLGWYPPEDLTPERVRPFFRFMTEHGVTSLFEALVEDDEILKAVAELDRRGQLDMYYEGALRFRNSQDLPEVIARLMRYQTEYSSEHIRMNTLKLFLDGTNEIGNSALIERQCLSGAEANYGELAMEADELADCFVLMNDAQVDAHLHLVGDRAFRVACDAVEVAQERARASSSAWTIQVTLSHCELIDPDDMGRPASLGIIINWTPHWSGGYFGEESKRFLGEERWARMYRFTEIVESGATLTFCSDVVTGYELERADPFFGMQVAHTRIDPEYPLDPDRFPASVRPDETSRIPLATLLKGYTIDAARQLRLDQKLGSLEIGKVANLNVLNLDPFALDAASIAQIRPDVVVFEGRVVAGSF